MKYKIKVKELKQRRKFNESEVAKNANKYLLTCNYYVNKKNLLMFKIFRNKQITRSSVSFIHNRCVVTLRHVLCFVYLKCHVIK